MSEFKRLNNESFKEYFLRIAPMYKDKGWNKIGEVFNHMTGSSYSSDTWRKWFSKETKEEYASSGFINESIDFVLEDICESQNELLEKQKREIERMKIQLRDERRAWNKQNYSDARMDTFLSFLEEKFSDISKVNYTLNKNKDIDINDEEMIVCLSDLHIGSEFKNVFGEFNPEIALKRLNKYLNEVISIGKLYKVKKVYVCVLGDIISGNIHKTIEVSNRENVTSQMKLAVEYISSFIYELAKEFNTILVSEVSGNHSRLKEKELAQHSERLDSFIMWTVMKLLQNVDNVHALEHRKLDEGIADINVCGCDYVLVHGDYDKPDLNGYMSLSNMLGWMPTAVISAHLHYCKYDQNAKFVQSGSFPGSGDDFTVEKRLWSEPSQMMIICNKKGIKALHPILLG